MGLFDEFELNRLSPEAVEAARKLFAKDLRKQPTSPEQLTTYPEKFCIASLPDDLQENARILKFFLDKCGGAMRNGVFRNVLYLTHRYSEEGFPTNGDDPRLHRYSVQVSQLRAAGFLIDADVEEGERSVPRLVAGNEA